MSDPLNVKAMTGVRLRELTDGTDPPDLYVPRPDGTPKFWVRVRPKVYLIAAPALNHGDAETPGYQDLLRDQEVKGTIGEGIAHAPTNAGVLTELAEMFPSWDFQAMRNHDEVMSSMLVSGEGVAMQHATFTFVITGLSQTAAHALDRIRNTSSRLLSLRDSYGRVPDAFVCPPNTVRQAHPFRNWMGVVENAFDCFEAQLKMLQGPKMIAKPASPTDSDRIALEEALGLLPSCVESRVMLTCGAYCLDYLQKQARGQVIDQDQAAIFLRMAELASHFFPSGFPRFW
jgi:hypothetical protein